jgi:hypothetical protein
VGAEVIAAENRRGVRREIWRPVAMASVDERRRTRMMKVAFVYFEDLKERE